MNLPVGPTILLVGNLSSDGQQSMLRYAGLLRDQLAARGQRVVAIAPRPRFARLAGGIPSLVKWLGYLDKYLLFPKELDRSLARLQGQGGRFLVHLCDHSNSLYLQGRKPLPSVVTCHDLLAVRSALGEMPEHPTRWSGRVLQRWILSGLRQAAHIVCVSGQTRRDVLRLTGLEASRTTVIHNGLHYAYAPWNDEAAAARVRQLLLPAGAGQGPAVPDFVLHVGNNSWYKNRLGVLAAWRELGQWLQPAPRLVLCGRPLTPAMRRLIHESRLKQSVHVLVGPSCRDLQALYSHARVFLFPSLAEGFGWPVAEALACGCPVVTSNVPPLTEVGGGAALYANPSSPRDLALQVLRVFRETPEQKGLRLRAGLAHAAGFTTERMISEYGALYARLGKGEVSKGPVPVTEDL